MAEQLFRLRMAAGEEHYEQIAGLLALSVPFGWEEQPLPDGGTLFCLHCEQEQFLLDLQQNLAGSVPEIQCTFDSVVQQDWLAAWREFFTPVTCGQRFVVLPPWLAQSGDFPGRIPILIEPKSAFGTGHHATTALCLAVLSDFLDKGRVQAGQHFLDLGTGSGILSIACCKSGLSGMGLDIDPLAIDNALENRALNNVAELDLATGSIELAETRRFDLVLANILARPLIELAPQITAVLADRANLVLSGLLVSQADDVERAYRECGLGVADRTISGEWCALSWEIRN